MAVTNVTGVFTRPVSAAIAANIRVVLGSNGQVSVADAGDKDLGVTANATFAAGEHVGIDMANKQGTTLHVIHSGSDAVAMGDTVYTAADGMVSSVQDVTSGSYEKGIAVEAGVAGGTIAVMVF